MGRANGDWCILRTSGPRTLALAASLAAAGFEAWTPTMMVERRLGRKRERKQRPSPIVPTFVFARASSAHDVARIANAGAAHDSPHPAFSIFRHRGAAPLIADRSLAPLRAEEERHRLRALKTKRTAIQPGARVCPTEGAWGGMTGVVESSTKKEAKVNFGGGFVVSIASYLLLDDVIQTGNSPAMGVAA